MQNGCMNTAPARPQSIIVETILELSNINADLERRIGNISRDRAQAHKVISDLEAQLKKIIEERDHGAKLIDEYKGIAEKAQASYEGIANNFDLVVEQRDQLKKANRKLSRELVKLMQYKKHYDKKGKN